MSAEKRVLVVDDEHAIADTLAIIFSNSGYSARAAYSAEEALPLIAKWNPQLVILDVRLPGRNGIDLAMQVKAEYPHSDILLFSGDSGTFELLESARQEGYHFDVLAKPIPPDNFLNLAAAFFPPPPRGLVPETV
jgi:DNA-binding NtrC family response regulator